MIEMESKTHSLPGLEIGIPDLLNGLRSRSERDLVAVRAKSKFMQLYAISLYPKLCQVAPENSGLFSPEIMEERVKDIQELGPKLREEALDELIRTESEYVPYALLGLDDKLTQEGLLGLTLMTLRPTYFKDRTLSDKALEFVKGDPVADKIHSEFPAIFNVLIRIENDSPVILDLPVDPAQLSLSEV